MSKKIKKLIKRYKKNLNYHVEMISDSTIETLEIQTDHAGKYHRIYIPDHNIRDIEILHELGHATLSETIHPLFSITDKSFVSISNREAMINMILPALRASDDWFVDQWLFELVPDEEKAEIDEHFKLATQQKSGGLEIEIFIGTAFLIAQAVKYLGININMGGDIKKAVDVFLSVNPKKPTVGKLQTLINGLLGIYSNFSLDLHRDQWVINGDYTC